MTLLKMTKPERVPMAGDIEQLKFRQMAFIDELSRLDRINLATQPIVEADDHQQVLYRECLVRLKKESGQPLPPAAFIPLFEMSGAITTLDRHVFERVVSKLSCDQTLSLGCNLSPQNLGDATMLSTIYERLAARPDIASRLTLELTEISPIQDVVLMGRFIERVRGLGCRVALDDFGAGYMTPNQLPSMEVDAIKIHASVIQFEDAGPIGTESLEHMVHFAKKRTSIVIVEGIETAEQAKAASNAGASHIQGFLISRPVEMPVKRRVSPGSAFELAASVA